MILYSVLSLQIAHKDGKYIFLGETILLMKRLVKHHSYLFEN